MASWTDEVLKFNPYIQEAPVEDLVRVGMAKQQLYDQGVQKVQGYLDSIRGMDVAKDVHKEYLQQRMNQLKGEVTKVISADFSKSQLTDQIGSLATRVAGDPIIQNALQSTARYKSEVARVQKDKADGKLMVQNEYDFQDRASKWLTDGDAESPFNESYNPYIDVTAEFLKQFKDLHPEANLTQDAIRIGKDGKPEINPAIEQTSLNGVTPERVANVVNMMFQRPEIRNQLRIEGKYNFRGSTPQMLLDNLRESHENTIKNIKAKVDELKSKAIMDTTANKEKISNDIDQLTRQGTAVINDFKASASLINTDPEAYKTAKYANDLKSHLLTYSWGDVKRTYEKSPLFDAKMTMLDYELDKLKFRLDADKFNYQKIHDAQLLQMDWAKAQLTARTSKGKKADGSSDELETFTTTGSAASSQGEAGSATFYDVKSAKKEELSQAMAEGVFNLVKLRGGMNPIKKVDGRFVYNVDKTGLSGYQSIQDAQAAHGKLYADARQVMLKGTPTPDVEELFAKVDPIIRSVKAIEAKEAEINAIHAPQIERLKATVGDLNTRVGGFNGKPVTRNDIVDLWLSQSGTPEAGNARERLKRRGLPPTIEGATFMIAGSPELNNEYKTIASKLNKNKELSNIYTAREKAYKDAQLTQLPLETGILATTPAEKERLRSIYTKIAGSRITAGGSEDIENFQDFLKKEEGSGDDKFISSNIYGFDRNNATGEVFLTITRGKDTRRMKVRPEDLAALPSGVANNIFWQRYGDELSLTGGETTDVPQANGMPGEENTAHIVPRARSSKSKYSVRYHVVKKGDAWDLKLYVRDRKGGIVAHSIPTGVATSMEGINQMVEELRSDTNLESILVVNGIQPR